MFIQNLFALYPQLSNNYQVLNQKSYNNLQKNIKLKCANKNSHIVSLSIKDNRVKLEYDIQKFANKKLISRNLFLKLINQYWQETIFLSVSSPMSDVYINNLKTSGVSVYNTKYKNFLLDFNKALNIGRIQSSININPSKLKKKSDTQSIKYIWKKGLNFNISKNLFHHFSLFNVNNSKNRLNYQTMKILKNNQVPIFSVINGFNQIIMAEPSQEIVNNMNLIDKVYQWYNNILYLPENTIPMYEGLFFIHPEDAIEYKNYIKRKYKNKNIENSLSVLANRLNFYYKISQRRISKAKFRLIPDLTEVGELLYRYSKLDHISFHKNQNYGLSHFQGQPIYLIQPTLIVNKKNNQKIYLNYYYEIRNLKKQVKNNALFMNYKTALLAWNKFKQKHRSHVLPAYPKILIYNLEDYIKDNSKNAENFLLVPSKDSYDYIKNNSFYKHKSYINQVFASKLLSLQVLTKRIIWSLTSRQPAVW